MPGHCFRKRVLGRGKLLVASWKDLPHQGLHRALRCALQTQRHGVRFFQGRAPLSVQSLHQKPHPWDADPAKLELHERSRLHGRVVQLSRKRCFECLWRRLNGATRPPYLSLLCSTAAVRDVGGGRSRANLVARPWNSRRRAAPMSQKPCAAPRLLGSAHAREGRRGHWTESRARVAGSVNAPWRPPAWGRPGVGPHGMAPARPGEGSWS